MENNKYSIKSGIYPVAVGVVTLAFMLTTNPQSLSPVMLIVPFVLFFLLISLCAAYIARNIGRAERSSITRKKLILILLSSAYPVMLLLLQSVGQLSIRDFITLSLLLVVSVFYVTKSGLGMSVWQSSLFLI